MSDGPDNIIHCQKCHYPVGIVRQIDGIEVLQVGAFLLRAAHGTCSNCGEGIHWDMGERALSRLIKHVLDLKIVV